MTKAMINSWVYDNFQNLGFCPFKLPTAPPPMASYWGKDVQPWRISEKTLWLFNVANWEITVSIR